MATARQRHKRTAMYGVEPRPSFICLASSTARLSPFVACLVMNNNDGRNRSLPRRLTRTQPKSKLSSLYGHACAAHTTKDEMHHQIRGRAHWARKNERSCSSSSSSSSSLKRYFSPSFHRLPTLFFIFYLFIYCYFSC